ncbi:MAG: hypothetical protein IKZ21_00740, partial [Clostridia bacterium]|nr:hypothetical protein [Clostridia bacterium]
MQTFFINIREGGVDLGRHERLLEGLVAQGDLFHHSCSLNAMGVCAEEIASRISRYDEVGEDYNLLVYIQVPGDNEGALAAECALSVLIEEELLANLYRLGRKPREVLIVFGENFTRNRQYGAGRGFAEKQRTALWNMFPFRPVEEVTEEVLTLKARGDIAESAEEFQNALSTVLFSDGQNSLVGMESIFLQEVLPVFSETVQKNNLDNEGLTDIFSKVVHNQRLHVSKQVTGVPVRYAHVRLKDSDYNARVRSEFRILLYVCMAADSGEFPMLEESADDASKNREIIGEASLPRLDLDALATELKKRYAILAEEYSLLDSGEEEFHAFKDDNL